MKQRPDLALPTDLATLQLFSQGNIVDSWAQKLYPGAVNVDGFGEKGAELTRQAIADGGVVLLQPTFIAGELSCRCDILVRN